MGIQQDSRHKRRKTGGKQKAYRKHRKFLLGRQAAHTKLGEKRVRIVRVRGGGHKHRALRLDSGVFSWGSEGISRTTRIISVLYNGANNEFVRTNTLVKGEVVQIDAAPFRLWYESYYGVSIGNKKSIKTDKKTTVKGAPVKGKTTKGAAPKKGAAAKKGGAAPAKGDAPKAKPAAPAKGAAKKAPAKGAAKKAPAKGTPAKDAKDTAAKSDKAAALAKGAKADAPTKGAKAAAPAKGAKAAAPAKGAKTAAPAKGTKTTAPAKGAKKGAAPTKSAAVAKGAAKGAKKGAAVAKGAAKSAIGKTKTLLGGRRLDTGKRTTKTALLKYRRRSLKRVIEPIFAAQFLTGHLLAMISSRPGQHGRIDGFLLEGKELEFYQRKTQKKKSQK